MKPDSWPDFDDSWGDEGGVFVGPSSGRDGRKKNAAFVIREDLLEIQTEPKKKSSDPKSWKGRAENVFRECQHIYGKRGENGESETNIINELTWIMWELSERVGEFSTRSEKKLSAAISLSAVEIAQGPQKFPTQH